MRVAGRVLAALSWLALAACAKPPPPDPDAQSEGAVPLPLAQKHDDSLSCKEGDCTDWYRIATPGNGELTVEVTRGAESVDLRGLDARLVDSEGATLSDAELDSSGHVRRARCAVTRGAVLVRVVASVPDARIAYSIRAVFTPAPPPRPPEPRFETRRSAVLEVEGRPGAPMFVLIDAGEGAALHAGMRGRLVDGGKSLGAIVIQDVYPDGSRARVEGPLSGAISPHTVAEIEVPIAPAAGAESPPEP
jgi:hypothetical protein